MKDMDKTEVAYNNGYSRGYRDGLKENGLHWVAVYDENESPDEGLVTFVSMSDGTLAVAEFFLGAWLVDEPEKVEFWMKKPTAPRRRAL